MERVKKEHKSHKKKESAKYLDKSTIRDTKTNTVTED